MQVKSPYNLLAILGPTASGKTALAAHLAHRLDGEVLSADSRQVYRGMDIGTGKDLADYIVEGTQVPVHLTDLVDAGYQYNVYEYRRDFLKALDDICSRGKFPVLCGGSGLYIEAVLKDYRLIEVPVNEPLRASLRGKSPDELTTILKNYKSKLHNITDIVNEKRAIRAIEIEEYYHRLYNSQSERTDFININDSKVEEKSEITNFTLSEAEGHKSEITNLTLRPVPCAPRLTENRLPITDHPKIYNGITPLIVGVRFDLETRRARITQRLHQRLREGMVEEVQHLLDSGILPENLVYYGLEYKFITHFLTGQLTYPEMVEKLNIAIHQFAKRQMTWFRKMEREGFIIRWLDGNLPLENKVETVLEWLGEP